MFKNIFCTTVTLVREAYRELLRAMAWLFEHNLPQGQERRRQTALALSALCVGGMVLSRTIDDPSLVDEIRNASMDLAIRIAEV